MQNRVKLILHTLQKCKVVLHRFCVFTEVLHEWIDLLLRPQKAITCFVVPCDEDRRRFHLLALKVLSNVGRRLCWVGFSLSWITIVEENRVWSACAYTDRPCQSNNRTFTSDKRPLIRLRNQPSKPLSRFYLRYLQTLRITLHNNALGPRTCRHSSLINLDAAQLTRLYRFTCTRTLARADPGQSKWRAGENGQIHWATQAKNGEQPHAGDAEDRTIQEEAHPILAEFRVVRSWGE